MRYSARKIQAMRIISDRPGCRGAAGGCRVQTVANGWCPPSAKQLQYGFYRNVVVHGRDCPGMRSAIEYDKDEDEVDD